MNNSQQTQDIVLNAQQYSHFPRVKNGEKGYIGTLLHHVHYNPADEVHLNISEEYMNSEWLLMCMLWMKNVTWQDRKRTELIQGNAQFFYSKAEASIEKCLWTQTNITVEPPGNQL